MTINLVLLVIMLIAAIWTVMGRSLLKATIGLALTSVIITMLIFRLNSPLAAVFELSVCAGLITVIFVSAISLIKPLTHKEILAISKERYKRYWYLPVVLLIAGFILKFALKIQNDFKSPIVSQTAGARDILWNVRHLDLFGQIIILVAGALGIVVLFIEGNKKND